MAKKEDGYSNRELTREMIVGTFIGSVFLVLVVFTIIISGSKLFSGGTHRIQVHFEQVGGLRRHDSVLVRGVPIGKVKRLKLNERGVEVELAIEEPLRLRQDYRIKVMNASLLGGMQLIIDEGRGEPLPGDTRLEGLPPDNVIEDFGSLVRDVRESLNAGGILANLQKAVEDIATVTGRLRRGEGTLGRLLSSDDTLYQDLQATLANIRAIAERVERGEGTLGKLLAADDTVYNDLQQTIASLRTVTGRLEAGEGTLGKLLAADDTVYRDLADTIANLKTVTSRLEAGEGLLGQLMNDESSIGAEFEGLLKDGRDMVDDMREASPISTFTSIFFGVF